MPGGKKLFKEILLRIKGGSFSSQYKEIRGINDRIKLGKFQEIYLKKLILHAYRRVPYYCRIFEDIGLISVKGEVDLAKFSKIPLLTKKVFRTEQLFSKDYKFRRSFYNSSGGSTGEPVRFIQDNLYEKWAKGVCAFYYRDMLGVDEPYIKKIVLWGAERDLFKEGFSLKEKVDRWLTNTKFLNSFKMNNEDMARYIKIINIYKPCLLRAYAGSLYELCCYAEKENLDIFTPKRVITSAERLTGHMRHKIEKVMRTKVYDFYGSREVSALTGECKQGAGHIFSFHNYVEILDENNGHVKEGQSGRVVVTNLHNYSMPFIRYEIGDRAIKGPNKCSCGSILPTLRKIEGRITDNFIAQDGSLVYGEYFTHLFYMKDWVRSFQLIQEDYGKIRILIILQNSVKHLEQKDIEDKIRLVMGVNCDILWNFVDNIPKTNTGKYLYTKSLLRRR